MSRRLVSTAALAVVIGLFTSGCALSADDSSPSAAESSAAQSPMSQASGQISGSVESGQSTTERPLPDWKAIAERIIAEAGTDQIVDAILYATGEARFTMRKGEGAQAQDVTLHFMASANKIIQESAVPPQPHTPISIRDVDWAKASAPFTPDCEYGTATLSWLPNGLKYRDYSCDASFATEAAWLNDNPIPNVPETPDAAAFQQGLDFIIPIIGHSAVQFSYSKKNARPGFTLVGPATTGPDGVQSHTVVNYEYAFEGDPVLKTQLIASTDVDSVTSDTPSKPTVAFDPTAFPAASYAKAIEDALAAKGATFADLQHAYFEAVSDSQIVYSILFGNGKGHFKGTITRP